MKRFDLFARPDRPKDQGELSAEEMLGIAKSFGESFPVRLTLDEAEKLLCRCRYHETE